MAVALLSESLRAVGARAREWGECALNLAFPWQESAEAEPVRVVPPFCRQCGYPHSGSFGADPAFVCDKCVERQWHFQWARAACLTGGQVREAVLGFKFHDEHFRYAQLVDWLTEAFDLHASGEAWDALVPVPLHHVRRRERGFNQARELARGLGRKRKIRVLDCLYRYRDTVSQTKLHREARWNNLADAFRLKPWFDVRRLNLLLIDDVFTTGATTNACAHVLANAGAGSLAVLTVARS